MLAPLPSPEQMGGDMSTARDDGGNTTNAAEGEGAPPLLLGMFLGVFVGFGVCCVISPVVHGLISRKKKAALKSGVECEGSLTAASVDTAQSEEGEVKAYYLEYEFHVPASSSTHPGQANGEFGFKALGWLKVSQQLHQSHATGLPKTCTVRYVPANPRYNQLVKVGDDDRPSREGENKYDPCCVTFMIVFTCVWLLGSLIGIILAWPADVAEHALFAGGLFPVVGAFAILSIAYPVRNYLRHKKGFTVFELSAAYQKPQPQAQPQPQVQPQPITFTTPADTTPAVGTRSL